MSDSGVAAMHIDFEELCIDEAPVECKKSKPGRRGATTGAEPPAKKPRYETATTPGISSAYTRRDPIPPELGLHKVANPMYLLRGTIRVALSTTLIPDLCELVFTYLRPRILDPRLIERSIGVPVVPGTVSLFMAARECPAVLPHPDWQALSPAAQQGWIKVAKDKMARDPDRRRIDPDQAEIIKQARGSFEGRYINDAYATIGESEFTELCNDGHWLTSDPFDHHHEQNLRGSVIVPLCLVQPLREPNIFENLAEAVRYLSHVTNWFIDGALPDQWQGSRICAVIQTNDHDWCSPHSQLLQCGASLMVKGATSSPDFFCVWYQSLAYAHHIVYVHSRHDLHWPTEHMNQGVLATDPVQRVYRMDPENKITFVPGFKDNQECIPSYGMLRRCDPIDCCAIHGQHLYVLSRHGRKLDTYEIPSDPSSRRPQWVHTFDTTQWARGVRPGSPYQMCVDNHGLLLAREKTIRKTRATIVTRFAMI